MLVCTPSLSIVTACYPTSCFIEKDSAPSNDCRIYLSHEHLLQLLAEAPAAGCPFWHAAGAHSVSPPPPLHTPPQLIAALPLVSSAMSSAKPSNPECQCAADCQTDELRQTLRMQHPRSLMAPGTADMQSKHSQGASQSGSARLAVKDGAQRGCQVPRCSEALPCHLESALGRPLLNSLRICPAGQAPRLPQRRQGCCAPRLGLHPCALLGL